MTNRAQYDSLKSAIETSLRSNGVETAGMFPVDPALQAARKGEGERRTVLSAATLPKDGKDSEVLFSALVIADTVSAAASVGIHALGTKVIEAPSELLVDLLARAEGLRALWYDLFIGRTAGVTPEERSFVESSASLLVAQAAECAVRFATGSRQLIDFAREKGLCKQPGEALS